MCLSLVESCLEHVDFHRIRPCADILMMVGVSSGNRSGEKSILDGLGCGFILLLWG